MAVPHGPDRKVVNGNVAAGLVYITSTCARDCRWGQGCTRGFVRQGSGDAELKLQVHKAQLSAAGL